MRRQRNVAHERTGQNARKRTKQNGKKLSDAEFKTQVIRRLKKLSENLNSIKKTQTEVRDALIKIKSNLQGNSGRVDEAKNHINNVKCKEAKNNHIEQEKRIPPKMRIVQIVPASGTTLRGPTFSSRGCQKKKRKSKKLEIYLKK